MFNLKNRLLNPLYGIVFLSFVFCFYSCEDEDLASSNTNMVPQIRTDNNVSVVNHSRFGKMLSFPSREEVFNLLSSWETPPSIDSWEKKLSFKSMRIGDTQIKQKYSSPVQLFLNENGYIMIADTVFCDMGNEVLYYDHQTDSFKHYLFNGKVTNQNVPNMRRVITKDKTVHEYLDTYNPNRPQDGYYRIDGWIEFDDGNWLTNAVVTAKTRIYVNGKRYNAHNIGVYYTFDIDADGKNKVEKGRRLESSRTYYFEQYLIKAKSLKIGYVYTTHYASGGVDDISASVKARME